MGDERPIILEPSGPPRFNLIWLHGLGADGQDLLPLAQAMTLPWPVRHILPHAPVRPVTLNQGWPMRAWFDMTDVDLMHGVSRTEIARAAETLWQELAQAVDDEPVVLIGFSQGGVMVQQMALQQPEQVAGVGSLSAWTPFEIPPNRLNVFVGHGRADALVPERLGRDTCQAWQAAGARVTCHAYPGLEHAIAPQEIEDLNRWLQESTT